MFCRRSVRVYNTAIRRLQLESLRAQREKIRPTVGYGCRVGILARAVLRRRLKVLAPCDYCFVSRSSVFFKTVVRSSS